MEETAHHDEEHGEGPSHGRITSPMQGYSMKQVGYGAVVLVVGLAITFGVGLLL